MYANIIVPVKDFREIREAIYFQLATAWLPEHLPDSYKDEDGHILPQYLPGGDEYRFHASESDRKLHAQMLKIDEMIKNNDRTT